MRPPRPPLAGSVQTGAPERSAVKDALAIVVPFVP